MEDRVLIFPGSSPEPGLRVFGRGLEKPSIDVIDGMKQVLPFFELPVDFREVSVQEALVESLADGYQFPQGLDFLLPKADEGGG
ncbi:MAG: hypothetical protein H6Q44_469 [Deltaproteobacteria bacterium]|nr:hypothetical protein [Deltaproteobacteria bacterium]